MKNVDNKMFEGPVGIAVLLIMSIGLGFQIGSQLF